MPGASGWTFAPNDLARALATAQHGLPASDDLTPDLVRARSVRAPARAIVVDNASARLWMLEHGRVIDSMKVIVGKRGMATPEMAGRITYATLNPYWNIPPDIVRASVAPKALSLGPAFLERERFELVDRYGLAAQAVDPAAVDWNAVMAGTQKVGVRQLPGGSNMMGAVKFIFPNKLGIYLHDTPNRTAFDRSDREISSGCVRVERAADLYRWIFGDDLKGAASQPEQRMVLREPVPVYLFRFSPGGSAAIDGAIKAGAAERMPLS
jgi:murein L,D-transpeptidase YcbB/YkuD